MRAGGTRTADTIDVMKMRLLTPLLALVLSATAHATPIVNITGTGTVAEASGAFSFIISRADIGGTAEVALDPLGQSGRETVVFSPIWLDGVFNLRFVMPETAIAGERFYMVQATGSFLAPLDGSAGEGYSVVSGSSVLQMYSGRLLSPGIAAACYWNTDGEVFCGSGWWSLETVDLGFGPPPVIVHPTPEASATAALLALAGAGLMLCRRQHRAAAKTRAP